MFRLPQPKNGEELIAQMRERYAGKWYGTLTFTQETTLPDRNVENRPTYVVGADAGDTVSPQFWIESERLYCVRSLEPSKKNPGVINDTRFGKCIPLAGGRVEMEVVFLANGRQKVKEGYSNAKANVKLNSSIFDPSAWKAPGRVTAK